MTTPTPPPDRGSSLPPGEPPTDGPTDFKPWLPAIGLGIVLVLLIVFFFLRSDGDDDTQATSTTTSSTTSTSTTSTSTAPPTTTPPTTAAPTTAPPTTAAPTTAPPTTAPPTTATTTDPTSAKLISDCNTGDEFACYEVGRLGLTPPASVSNPASWKNKTDDEVATACQQDLNVTACYVAGTRGLVLGD